MSIIPEVDNLQDVIQRATLPANNLFVKPIMLPTAENDQTVNIMIHDATCFYFQFLQFDFCDFTFKY